MSNHFPWDHNWKAKAVRSRVEPVMNSLTMEVQQGIGKVRTDILYVCDCGKVKTKTIRGDWKLEEVTP